MFQRIDASRAVFSVNMKSAAVEKPGSGYALAQSRRPNHMRLRAVSPLEHPVSEQAKTETILPPPDRRMSRRRVSSPTAMPLGISRQKKGYSPAGQMFAAADHFEAEVTQPLLTEVEFYDEPTYEPTTYNKAAVIVSPLNISSPSDIEEVETEEPYFIDRPVFLLGQKYFGTRV